MRATDMHRIIWTRPDTLTLVLAGPVVRPWGFHTSKGWVPWREYKPDLDFPVLGDLAPLARGFSLVTPQYHLLLARRRAVDLYSGPRGMLHAVRGRYEFRAY